MRTWKADPMSHDVSTGDRRAAGYSSEVQLLLVIEGGSYALAQIGPDFVTLREPADLPLGEAEVIMLIDGLEQDRWAVTLQHRVMPSELEFATADR
jgi:hypothetical protein